MTNLSEKKWQVISKIDDSYFQNRLGDLQTISLYQSKSKTFSREQIKKLFLEQIKKKDATHTSLYLHVPFCSLRCTFCCYKSNQFNKQKIQKYVKSVKEEINYYQDATQNIKFDSLYIGGGTPNILSEEELDEILKEIFEKCSFKINAEIKIECNPEFITQNKLKILKKYGFNSLSYGIQSLDPEVLDSINRKYQKLDKIRNAINWSKALNFKEINADLMIGLKNDSNEKFLNSLSQIIGLRPTSITLYKIKPTKEYFQREILLSDRGDVLFNHTYDVEKLFKDIKYICEEHEYHLNECELNTSEANMSITLKTLETYEDKPKRKYDFSTIFPATCLGLGLYSQTHIFEKLLCQNRDENYNIPPTEKSHTGNEISTNLETLSPLVNYYYMFGHIPLNKFKEYFSVPLKEKFSKEINELKIIQKIKTDENRLIILDKKDIVRVFLYLLNSTDIKKLIKQKKLIGEVADE